MSNAMYFTRKGKYATPYDTIHFKVGQVLCR